MKTCALSMLVIGLGLSLNVAVAERDAEGGKRGKGRHRGPRAGLVMKALDADQDGTLSAAEIENASAALLTLDQDQDGTLSRAEMHPPREGRGRAARIMELDANGDGLVTVDEMPERMQQRLLEFADTNGDEAIDQAEADALEAERKERRGGRRGGRGQRGPRFDDQE